MNEMMNSDHVDDGDLGGVLVIAGANGFMGRYLSEWFLRLGWRVVALVRREEGCAEGVEVVLWDGVELGEWAGALEGASVLVNLAGRTVNCRYGEKNRREILDSRVLSTRVLGRAVAGCEVPPSLWVNASTATIYRDARDRPQGDEDGELGEGFSVEVAKAWEREFFGAEVPGEVRKVAMRTAIVLGREEGTVWEVLKGLARRYLGGKMGSGEQMVSWVSVEDFCRAVEWFVREEGASGVYNVAVPNPVSNAEMMRVVRGEVGVSWGLPATEWMLEIGAWALRTETELILKSRWVVPTRLLREGFVFECEEMGGF